MRGRRSAMSTSTEGQGEITAVQIKDILVSNAGASPDLLEEGREESLEELGLDSLAVLELQAVVKDRFGIEIPEEALEMSVSQIVALANNNRGDE
jgi:acyl carrier protein